MKPSLLYASAVIAAAVPATVAVRAEAQTARGTQTTQDPRDDEIFGSGGRGPAEPATATDTPAATAAAPAKSSALRDLTDNLQIGGRLELRAAATQSEGDTLAASPLAQQRQADVYFDARPNDDLRAFLRTRFSERTPPPAGETTSLHQDIDELWLKWDVDDAVFFTAGKQHLKWGSGHFWNPTDFTATTTRDPFDLTDRRLGQNLIKLHLPLEKQAFNFYGVVQLDGDSTASGAAEKLDDVGGALRAELAFLGVGEAAFSLQTRPGRAQRLGADVSSALGPIDAYVEAAAIRHEPRLFYDGSINPATGELPTVSRRRNETFVQVVGGVTKSWKYSDSDSLTTGVEYFDNPLGYADRELELYAFVNSQVQPLYAGRRYAGAYVLLPTPGPWNRTSLFLNGIRNLSDATSVVRLTASWTMLDAATLEAYVSRCQGDYGELCFRIPPSLQALAPGLPSQRALTSLGAGLSVRF